MAFENVNEFSIDYNGLELDYDALSAMDPENIKDTIAYNIENANAMKMRSVVSFAGAVFIGFASFMMYGLDHLGPLRQPDTDAGNRAKNNAKTRAVMGMVAAGACLVGGMRARNKNIQYRKQAGDLDEALVMSTHDFNEAQFDATVPNLKAKGFITQPDPVAYPSSARLQ